MQINPYDSPSPDASVPSGPISDQPPTHPVGVSILSVLHALGGLVLGALLVAISNFSDNEQWLAQRGLTFIALVAAVGMTALLAIACGTGMWFGAKWSWWLAAFYYFSMFFGDVFQLLLIAPIKARSHGFDVVEELVINHVVRGAINLLLLCYLFKANVLRFFGLSTISKLKAIGILFSITLVFIGVVAVFVTVHFINHRP